MNTITHNKGVRLHAEPLTRDEMELLLGACSKRAPTGRRDRALLCVLWRGQLRITEALSLKPSDFNPDDSTIRVLNGKGGKSRVAVIDDKTSAALSEWLGIRGGLGVDGRQPLFCTLQGKRINAAQMRAKIKRLGRKAGIAKRVHLHGLRHTGASELASEGFDLKTIQEQLGHSSAATTDRYLHAINPVARAAQLRARAW